MPHSVPRPQRDRIDRAIVTRLQVDGRLANVDLADAVSLSPSACLRRVKALEADGIIAGYRAEVDRSRAGLDLTVFIELRVEGHSKGSAARIEQALTAIPAVVACYEGMGAERGPAGVGEAVNRSVVVTGVALFVVNFILTEIFLYAVPARVL